jgi:hypothetical protein
LKALKEAQLRNARTEQTCLALRKEVAAMSISKNQRQVPSNSSHSSRSVTPFSRATPEPAPASTSGTVDDNSDDDGLDSTTRGVISKIAKRFGTMGELFLTDAEIFRQRCPKSFPGNITHSDRYVTPESMKEGIISELYSVVPERLHETMQNDGVFGKMVRPTYLQLCTPT